MGNNGLFLFLVTFILAAIAAPVSTRDHRIVTIKKNLNFTVAKNNPSRVAFDEWKNRVNAEVISEWSLLKENRESITLNGEVQNIKSAQNKNFQITLPVFKFTADRSQYQNNLEWIAQLPAGQKNRILEAQDRSKVLYQDWANPDWQLEIRKKPEQIPVETIKFVSANTKKLSNQIEIEHGLPVGGDFSIHLSHIENGKEIESGSVNPETGTYNIAVGSTSGYLRATLQHQSGYILGEGISPVNSDLAPRIVISKRSSEVNVTSGSYYDSAANPKGTGKGKGPGTKDIKTHPRDLPTPNGANGDGNQNVLNIDKLSSGSQVIVYGEGSEYTTTALLATTTSKRNLRAVPKAMTDAMEEILNQYYPEECKQFPYTVIGDVSGLGVENYTVSTPEAETKIIYLNQLYIPDPQLKATSSSGSFIILTKSVGATEVVLQKGNEIIDSDLAFTEPESIFQLTFSIPNSLPNKKTVSVFDAFSGEGQAANVKSAIISVMTNEIEGYSKEVSASLRSGILRVEPEDTQYIDMYQWITSSDMTVNTPLVTQAWMNSVYANQKTTMIPSRGVIIGFVQNDEFEVYLPSEHLAQGEKTEIVYFDKYGNISTTGIRGGGFVILNVNPGIHTLVVSALTTDGMHTRVLDVKDAIPNVFNLSF